MQTSQLDQIMRQKGVELPKTVQHLATGETGKGVELLAQQGRVTEVKNGVDRIAAIAKDYAAQPENTLVVSPDNYHRHCVAKRAFSCMDFEIWRKLWWWSYRRHPGKNCLWVKNRYYHAIGERTWRFAVRTNIQNPWG
jgi:hypothetical protein